MSTPNVETMWAIIRRQEEQIASLLLRVSVLEQRASPGALPLGEQMETEEAEKEKEEEEEEEQEEDREFIESLLHTPEKPTKLGKRKALFVRTTYQLCTNA